MPEQRNKPKFYILTSRFFTEVDTPELYYRIKTARREMRRQYKEILTLQPADAHIEKYLHKNGAAIELTHGTHEWAITTVKPK